MNYSLKLHIHNDDVVIFKNVLEKMKIYTELKYKTSNIFFNITEFEIKWKDDNPKLLFFLGMNFQFLISIENLKNL